MIRNDLRNIAIIAHVDHGKTTLVDAMLKQSGIFRANERVEERVMDSNDQERERGITILAKNTAVMHEGTKINILDTPGHADFGGEVERVLRMVDGVLLLVDAYEGPMPQTKYVLRKALEQNLKPIVVINKIDRPDQRVDEVVDEVLDLFIELNANDAQLEFPVVYASARNGIAKLTMDEESSTLEPLFRVILENIPAPEVELEAPLQMLVNTLDYDDYVGRIVVGRIVRGVIHNGENIMLMNKEQNRRAKIGRLYSYQGLKRIEVQEAGAGDIVALIGLADADIGETIASVEQPELLEGIAIDEPTLSMVFSINNSPFAGREGTFVTSRHLRERLFKEMKTNVSMRLEETESPDSYIICGRGELHLSVLIETMRREGYELQAGKPKVVMQRTEDGRLQEPMEALTIDVPQDFMGAVMEGLGLRKAELLNITEMAGYLRMEFNIPARGLIGFRNQFLTDTKGNGVMNHVFAGYADYKGDIPGRTRGSLVAFENGETTSYGIANAQERGTMFIVPGEKIYEGQIIGENSREDDMDVNPCKKKHVSNMRASGSDDTVKLIPPKLFSLEQALEHINEDELVEVTPKSIRMRKKILDRVERGRARSRNK
ncbi:MAG TPA: translational GTPase TypA [Candidatus Avacidaminococcus intestinavium]|uniref:Large ribosomal subunit assembly factor BipA n=1 Tax=Candidatus Avacidaminococcus intestinavium TaxID=2840684 RepID=A0A9D1SL35_9FIRM|nr:translational GTPase TypA [Candidatus Avacidaminococcus intestinavium]